MKSPAISPPRKYQVPDHYNNITINKQDPILAPHLAKYCTEYKPLLNHTRDPDLKEDNPNNSTDNSRTEIDKNDEYKYENSQDLNND